MSDFQCEQYYDEEEVFSAVPGETQEDIDAPEDYGMEPFEYFEELGEFLEKELDSFSEEIEYSENPCEDSFAIIAHAEEHDNEEALERELARTLWDLRHKDVVSTISEYRMLRKKHDPILFAEYHEKYGEMSVEDLLLYYHSGILEPQEKAWVREQIYLYVFFLLPYAVRKGYSMRAQIFSDAMQNMSVAVLQAIEMYKPGLGYKFSNYLIGYFRGGITKTVRESVVVTAAPARKKLIGSEEQEEEKDPADVEYENTWYRYTKQTGVPPVMPDGDTPVGDQDSMDLKVHNTQLVDWLEEALSREAGVLTDDEARVIILHYGLFGNRPHIYPEIAEIRKAEGRGCACSRISQINTHAIQKLRKWFEERNIEE